MAHFDEMPNPYMAECYTHGRLYHGKKRSCVKVGHLIRIILGIIFELDQNQIALEFSTKESASVFPRFLCTEQLSSVDTTL